MLSCWSPRLLLLVLCVATPAAGQDVARLATAREVVVTAERADLTEIGTTLLLRNGDLIMTQYRDGVVRRFDHNGTPTVMGRKGEGPGEFQMPTVAGTVGDTLWISDVRLRRTTFFHPDRTLLRTVPWPDAAKASGNGVRWQMLLPLAYLRDGALLADGMHDATAPRPAWATAVQWSGSAILRLAPGGAMQRVVAWLPANDCTENVPIAGGDVIVRIPFCAGTPRHIDPETGRIALALFEAGLTRVVVLSATGDTLLAKELRFPPVAIPTSLRDSARQAEAQRAGAGGPAFDKAMARMPTVHPSVTRILNGRDGTTWIEVATPGPDRTWQILDARGNVTGAVRLPRAVNIAVAERGIVWGVATDEDGLMQVVRFRVGAATR